MAAYFNEWDKPTAEWLRELMKRGLIPDGVVDDRSIIDVDPADLKGFTQCHFFAGIGGWSHALRLAGVPDDRPLWTGSPPCQPFSVAGKGLAQDDPRHLAPTFLRLIRECRPVRIFGEQVAAAIGKHWLDDLFTELEGQGYTCGAAVLPACSVGAPHKRDRLFFGAVAEPMCTEWDGEWLHRLEKDYSETRSWAAAEPAGHRGSGGVAHARFSPRGRNSREIFGEKGSKVVRCDHRSATVQSTGSVAHANDQGLEGRFGVSERSDELITRASGVAGGSANPDNGFWDGADWLGCRDGKFRPVRPGAFPLANGIPARVVRLRGYGNAIVPPLAKEFILAFEEAIEDLIRSGRADIDELI